MTNTTTDSRARLQAQIDHINALNSPHAHIEQPDDSMMVLHLSPVAALSLLIGLPQRAEARAVMAKPFGMKFFGLLRDNTLKTPDLPETFNQVFGQRRPLVKLDAAMGLYCYASDSGAPKEAAPTAAFALQTVRDTLATQAPAWGYNFVKRREGIIIGIPELADVAAETAQRALRFARNPEKLAEIRTAYQAYARAGTPVIRNAPV